MRKLKIFEHISLDGMIQSSADEGAPARAFELASTKALPSGVLINAYKFAGPLRSQQ